MNPDHSGPRDPIGAMAKRAAFAIKDRYNQPGRPSFVDVDLPYCTFSENPAGIPLVLCAKRPDYTLHSAASENSFLVCEQHARWAYATWPEGVAELTPREVPFYTSRGKRDILASTSAKPTGAAEARTPAQSAR